MFIAICSLDGTTLYWQGTPVLYELKFIPPVLQDLTFSIFCEYSSILHYTAHDLYYSGYTIRIRMKLPQTTSTTTSIAQKAEITNKNIDTAKVSI